MPLTIPLSFQLCSLRQPSSPQPPSCVWHSHAYLHAVLHASGKSRDAQKMQPCLLDIFGKAMRLIVHEGPWRVAYMPGNARCRRQQLHATKQRAGNTDAALRKQAQLTGCCDRNTTCHGIDMGRARAHPCETATTRVAHASPALKMFMCSPPMGSSSLNSSVYCGGTSIGASSAMGPRP